MVDLERKALTGRPGKRSHWSVFRRNRQAVAVACMIVVFIGYNWFMFSKHVQIRGDIARSKAHGISSVIDSIVRNARSFEEAASIDESVGEVHDTEEPTEDKDLPVLVHNGKLTPGGVDDDEAAAEEESSGDATDLSCNKEAYVCSGGVHRFPTNFSDGERYACKFNVFTDTAYLPDPRFYTCIQRNKPKDWLHGKKQMIAKIKTLQFPPDCNNPDSALKHRQLWTSGVDENGFETRVAFKGRRPQPFPQGKPKWTLLGFLNHGYAYNLYVFSWLAGNYWAHGASVVVGNSKYRFSDVKCGKSWSCLWTPLTKCKLQDIDRKRVLVFHGGSASWRDVMTLDQVCRPNGRYSMSTGRCQCDPKFLPSRNSSYRGCAAYSSLNMKIDRIRDHVETWERKDEKLQEEIRDGDELYFAGLAPFESNPHGNANHLHDLKSRTRVKYGFIWEHAQWLWYLHREAPKRKELDTFLYNVGLRPNTDQRSVGVHVRHGDSCHDIYQTHRVCLPLSNYMNSVKKLEAIYGKFDVVYLATDDPKVISDTRLPEYRSYKFLYQGIDRTMYETDDHNGVDIREEFNAPDVVMEIARDIWALAHCDAFVGSFASSVAWVAYELSIARNGHYTPFVSVDMPFAHKKNIGRFLDSPNE